MSVIKVGQKYTTQKSGVTGRIVRIDVNPTGTARVCLFTGLKRHPLRWTTYVPERRGEVVTVRR